MQTASTEERIKDSQWLFPVHKMLQLMVDFVITTSSYIHTKYSSDFLSNCKAL